MQINGVVRFKVMHEIDASKEQIENLVMQDEKLQQYVNGKEIKKIIVIPGRIVNIVVQ